MQVARIILLCTAVSCLTGCLFGRQNPAATQPATAGLDPRSAQPDYWLSRPAVASVRARSFDRLWDACRDAAEADGFQIDRRDYRQGLLTTLPLVSKAIYEVWRRDVVTPHDLVQSTLGTIRRTIRFTIRRTSDGGFIAEPKVVVENYSTIERRITSVSQYAYVFSITLADVSREAEQTGLPIPAEYWYCIARDPALERELAASATARLRRG